MALTWPTLALAVSFDNTRWFDDGVAIFVLLTTRIKRISYRRGRQRQLGTPQAGTLTVVLDNADGVLDPDNSSSPYYGTMHAGRLLALSATYNSVLYPLFIGRVTSWLAGGLSKSREPEVVLQVSDYLAQFARNRDISGRNIGGIYNGEMIDYWYGRWNTTIPAVIDRGTALVFDIDTTPGNGVFNGSIQINPRTIFDLLQQCEAEATYFFNGAGEFVFHDGNRRHGVQPLIQATFDNDATAQTAGSLPFEGIDLANDDTDIYNDVELTPYGGSTLWSTTVETGAITTTSKALHGSRPISRTLPLLSSVQAQDLADRLATYHKDAVGRITGITVNGLAQVSALWDAILGLEISDPIRIRRRPYPVRNNTTAQDFFIEGYQVNITVDGPQLSWQVHYDLSPWMEDIHPPLIGGAGVAFPSSPLSGELFFRTDLGLLCYWTGSRWLTVHEYSAEIGAENVSAAGILDRIALRSNYTIYMTRLAVTYFVQTTNNGSNYWTLSLQDSPTSSNITQPTTAAGTASTWTSNDQNINAITTANNLRVSLTKTGAPGNLYGYITLYYRLVVT